MLSRQSEPFFHLLYYFSVFRTYQCRRHRLSCAYRSRGKGGSSLSFCPSYPKRRRRMGKGFRMSAWKGEAGNKIQPSHSNLDTAFRHKNPTLFVLIMKKLFKTWQMSGGTTSLSSFFLPPLPPPPPNWETSSQEGGKRGQYRKWE